MKFRKITVNSVEYGWRVWGSADNIEVRGPHGKRVFADAEEVTGVDFGFLNSGFWEFDRRHKHPFYAKYPITPRLIAAWIANHVDEMAQPSKKRFHKSERYPNRKRVNFEAVA